MKWITHQTGAVLGAAVLGMSIPAVALSLAGAIFPDLLDQKGSSLVSTSRKARQKVFNRVHRGASHWFGWYAALFVFISAWPLPVFARDCAAGFALGALSHVILDMLTPQGIPLTPFSRKGKLAAPICVTGHWSEYAFLMLMISGAVWYLGAHGVLDGILR